MRPAPHSDAASLIAAVRRRSGLTQAEFAHRAGTSQPVVSAYEHGHRDPSCSTLAKLVAAGGERLRITAVPASALPAMSASAPLDPPADVHEHAARLLDVLTLVDALPSRRRSARLDAPRLISTRPISTTQ
jgi:uncharacterized protein